MGGAQPISCTGSLSCRQGLRAYTPRPSGAGSPLGGTALEHQRDAADRCGSRRHHHGQPLGLADDEARRRRCSTRWASPTRPRWSPPTARPSGCTTSPRAPRRPGFKVIIAGAGGAAHLPGMTASMTDLPVLGVPVRVQGAEGHRLPALHRADARRRAGRHPGHRRGGGQERRPAGGPDPGPVRRGAGRAAGRLPRAPRPRRCPRRSRTR